MPLIKTDLTDGLAFIDDLVRLTAPPASEREIAEQGLALTARALRASGAALYLRPEAGTTGPVVWGRADPNQLAPAAERAMGTSDIVEESLRGRAWAAIPLPGAAGPVGAIVLAEAAGWGQGGRLFAASAARTIASALQAARLLVASRQQGELLAQRNVELEILRELTGRIQERSSDEEILQAALDLVLDKLGLAAGWIFWGESLGRRLELAASRGVTESFVCQARDRGIGECLCQDVFATGKLRLARNTIDCPRLPDLVVSGEPMTHACVPLNFERGTQGVMNIANRPGRLFAEQELRFLETVGRQVCLAVDKARTARAEGRRHAEARALAIENARLYREAQEMFLGLQRAQDGMLRAERLAAVGTLASSLAHEVRNPLNSISLQLVLLSRRLNRLEGEAREEMAALVESARGEIDRLDGLVEEFLSLSSIDRLALSETDPRAVVREVSAMMTPVARQKNIAVVEDLADSLAPLRLDPEKMKQVLLNLARNGIEAMPQGGTLTLTTRASAEAVVIQVADTGVGIEPGLEIFSFFTTTKRDGTGLGLPIARRIVEAHGGTLTCESAPGHGTTFSVTLPRPEGGR
jgi:signal transduction histidine kinase